MFTMPFIIFVKIVFPDPFGPKIIDMPLDENLKEKFLNISFPSNFKKYFLTQLVNSHSYEFLIEIFFKTKATEFNNKAIKIKIIPNDIASERLPLDVSRAIVVVITRV